MHVSKAVRRGVHQLHSFILALLLAIPSNSLNLCALAEDEIDPSQPKLDITFRPESSSIAEPPATAVAANQPLLITRIEELVDRLKPLQHDKRRAIVIPEQSLIKPKLPGRQTVESFPPQATSTSQPKPSKQALASNLRPLTVERISHSGNVDNIEELSITFSQPMVAIGEMKPAAPSSLVTLTPQPAGHWRWVGTQTILFIPENKRFPKSTEYKVNIPAGTKAANGDVLAEEKSYTIITPSISIRPVELSEPLPKIATPILVATFDQDADSAEILKYISVSLGKDKYPIGLADIAELDKTFQAKIATWNKKRWIAYKPLKALPLGQTVDVTFSSGAPSLEGPLRSTKSPQYHFKTHGPLIPIKTSMRGGHPENGATLSFSNVLDQTKFKAEMVKISPASSELTPTAYGNNIFIQGAFKPFAKYHITIDKNLTNIYGQTLGKSYVTALKTGPLYSALSNNKILVNLPTKQPTYRFWAQGSPTVKVLIRKNIPEDWWQFRKCLDSKREPTPGTIVSEQTITIKKEGESIAVNLQPYLKEGSGQFTLEVETTESKPEERLRIYTWLQVTDIAIDAFASNNLRILTSSLSTAAPIGNVNLNLLPADQTTNSAQDGQAVMTLDTNDYQACLLIARKNNDIAILPASDYGPGWRHNPTYAQTHWYAVSDRGLYKPGETVYIKGWARNLDYTKNDALKLSLPEFKKVSYKLMVTGMEDLCQGEADVDQSGGFSIIMKIPNKVNLGTAYLSIWEGPAQKEIAHSSALVKDLERRYRTSTSVEINIQEFRRPEFELSVASTKGNTMIMGQATTLEAAAKYFTGSGLPRAPIDWNMVATPSRYAPPGWHDYSFYSGYSNSYYGSKTGKVKINNNPDSVTSSLKTRTNSLGLSKMNLEIKELKRSQPLSVTCEATVTDINKQKWSDKVSILVHPSDTCIGVKANKSWYHINETVSASYIATDLDGKAKEGSRIELSLLRTAADSPQQLEIAHRSLTSEAKPTEIEFPADQAGYYMLVATSFDNLGRCSESSTSWSVEKHEARSSETAQQNVVKLTADSKEYQPGDTAEIIVDAPFSPAQGLVTITRHNIISTAPLKLTTKSTVVKVPVSEDDYPNFSVEVHLSGNQAAFATGSVNLAVPPKARALKLTLKPASKDVSPGNETAITIDVHDAQGKAIKNAKVALAVADEAVLALAKHKWEDPLALFYPNANPRTHYRFGRNFVVIPTAPNALKKETRESSKNRRDRGNSSREGYRIEGPRDMNMFQVEPTVVDERHYSDSGSSAREKSITVRQDFSALALFAPAIVTDENGRATVKMHMPDSLTRYRIMAVAAAGSDRFGSAESSISAKLSLTVKPSAPNFLNFGDTCTLPIVVQNDTDKPLTAEVLLRGSNINLGHGSASEQLSQTVGQRVTVPAHDRIAANFAIATDQPGIANFQAAVVSGAMSDAAEFSIPIMVPASTETFATYGEIDNSGAVQKLNPPKNVYKEIGGLTVSTSSTAVQSLVDAYFYLHDYRFACSEQLSARLIAMLSLENVLTAFGKLEETDKAKFKTLVQNDIDLLSTRQRANGGFGLWQQSDPYEWPYVSIQVIRALALAKEKGYVVEQSKLDKGCEFLRRVMDYISSDYSPEARYAIEARAINVLHLMNETDASRAVALINQATAKIGKGQSAGTTLENLPIDRLQELLPLESAAWLLPVISKEESAARETAALRRLISSQIKETASTASCNADGYSDCDYYMFYSHNRTNAVVLEALMADQPNSSLIPKLVRGLLGHRKNGIWQGTQENGYILQALDRYFSMYESKTPNFECQTWVGDTLASIQQFKGRSTDTKSVTVPTEFLLTHKNNEVLIAKNGPGRLYYRMALNYAPLDLAMKPADHGFTIERTYTAVNKKSDVSRDEHGTWHIKAGAIVRSTVKFKTPGARYHVAMIDPLPAGAEPVNPELAGHSSLPTVQSKDERIEETPETPTNLDPPPFNTDSINLYTRHWWPEYWFEHTNLRARQAEAFSSLLNAGHYEYSYLMHATTAGDFHVAPAKVEEMYAAETFGRSATEHVVIE